MKPIVRSLLCLAILTATQSPALNEALHAQETFAPLISEHCVAFVHVDFSKVELDKIKTTLQKTGEDLLKELGFDDKSFKATARELTVELEKLDILARPVFNTITKELGIREYALIFDMDIIETNRGVGILAIPWKGKTDKQLETLKKLLEPLGNLDSSPADLLVKVGDFLILPLADEDMTKVVEEMVKGWIAKGTPEKSPILDALKSVSGAEVKFAVAIPDQVRQMIRTAPMPPDMPIEIRNLLLFAAQKIEWASASVSLADILGTEPPKNADVLLTLKTSKPSDAKMLRGMLENAIELGVNATQFAMSQRIHEEGIQLPPLTFQFAKGLLRTLLPDVEEDKLIVRLKGQNAASKQVVVATVGVSVALLLPAVQASREAARRMQCMNHMKVIVLAIHNYHDARGVLPPLYTVDADGKPLHSWRVLLLPYMEQTALYSQIRLNEPWDSEYNKQFHNVNIPVYRCPSNPNIADRANCNFAAIAGEGFVPAKKAGSMGDYTMERLADGTSDTIAIVEVKQPFCWMDPTADVTLDELSKGINVPGGRVGSFHTNGCNVGMFDGSVRFFNQTIDLKLLRALGTCAGGESVGGP